MCSYNFKLTKFDSPRFNLGHNIVVNRVCDILFRKKEVTGTRVFYRPSWFKVVFWRFLDDWKCARLWQQWLESLGAADNNPSGEIWICVPPKTLQFAPHSQTCYLASLMCAKILENLPCDACGSISVLSGKNLTNFTVLSVDMVL